MVLGLPTSDQTKMKKKRRTLKNRGYAETTRRKKEAEINQLEQELADLKVGLKLQNFPSFKAAPI